MTRWSRRNETSYRQRSKLWLVLASAALALVACKQKREHHADVELARAPVVHSAPKKLVVLGSSTSAGVGPSEPQEAYVPRYQTYLARQFPDCTLVNLAAPGQTTYHIQPTGFRPPPNRPAPAVGKNIDAIIVNMPSNDAAANIPAAEQLDNFARLAKLAREAHVRIWFSSTQPRNFSEAQIAIQRQVAQAILKQYAPQALDFWTPFATAAGTLKSDYDAGDGIHLNAAGHSILLRILVGATIATDLVQGAP